MRTGRDIERMARLVLVRSEDRKEGMAAFFERRAPGFAGRRSYSARVSRAIASAGPPGMK